MNAANHDTAPPTPASPDSRVALVVKQLSKSFLIGKRRIQALQDVSFSVRHGVVTGLVGPDAAGKTTLMRLAAGLLVPDSGAISVLGMDAATQSLAVQGSIGYMPQRFGLYEDLTVQENLDLYADLQGVPETARAERYRELMHMAGLAPFARRLAGQLSGGMKQKLGLACALVRQPQLLLLDEPTVGVDPLSRRELWDIVYRLVREQGTSVLLTTAYLDEAERCDDVVLLHEGRLLDQGAPAVLRETMRGHTYRVTVAGMDKRVLQNRIAQAPGVMDALIQGDHVRVVMESDTPVDFAALCPAAVGIESAAVAPRFEDSFVALIKRKVRGDEGSPVHDNKVLPAHVTLTDTSPPPAGEREQDRFAKPVIEVSNLQRTFGSFYAVNNISFTVQRGEVFGLLGANGAGKSTTFRMLCGLLPPSSGTLRVAGADLRHAAAAARARIGYMSQKFSLYGNLSVAENLQFFSSAYDLTGTRRKQRIDWALQEFELSAMADVTSGDLSLGYKQRLALACALMHEPEILFLDEPTSGVDPLARREFWSRINALAGQGVTIMVTTHFMEEAEYCDRLAIMAAGEILTMGTPGSIKAQARNAAQPEPTMEDAFVGLIMAHEKREAA
ncbi:ATP-binding cassette domain-containing protein [Sideroxydans lithotrophicus]|uniref:ABC transporter related protein n=1 Tax=Sideroxydans lithotrophicus (strain ES-1) TaxID=580332 RepID=D5CN40_SIDLE|nr:ATP-binding cassette domain-containing protein [Sideroxydans lithotrophicus]ADE12737.1 ABC transporter related protein [Sideroxydans lithotrophicus ES-1]